MAVQDALHRIGRRFGQRRALRVFRDDTNLEVSQDLWGKITEAMHHARFMVVVLSPGAARSKWVNAEVEHWIKQRNGPQPMMVLAGGHLVWDDTNWCFNPLLSDAAPPALTVPGVLPVEPFFLDVSTDGPPWSASAAGFRDKMTALAAPIHGKPKDQLAGDDLREFRKARRLRRAALVTLSMLVIVAIVLGSVAFAQWQDAEAQRRAADHQRDEAVAARLTAEARSMLGDSVSGNDVVALQRLLAARTVTDSPDDGALYNAVVEKQNVVRVMDAGAPVYGGTTNPDGTRLVTGGGSDDARIWDLNTGEPVDPPLVGHTDPISAAQWSPDGTFIATASLDRTLRLWDAATGEQRGEPGQHEGSVLAVAISPDNTLVATASEDKRVRLWSVTDDGPQLIQVLGQHGAAARAVAFSPNGAVLASVGLDGSIGLWDVAARQQLKRDFAPAPMSMLLGVSWSFDGRTLATAGWDGVIRLWNADTGQQLDPLVGHTSPVINTAFIGNDFLASGSFDGTIRMWDVQGHKQVGDAFVGPDGGVAVNFAVEGRLTAVSNDHTIRLLNIMTGQELASHLGLISAVSFSPDRDRFASGSWDGTVGLFEASTNRGLGLLPGDPPAAPGVNPRRAVTATQFGPRGRLLVGRADASVELWDVTSVPSERLSEFDVCWPPSTMALSRDGKQLAVACPDGQATDQGAVQLWDLDASPAPTSVWIPDGRGPVGPVALSPDGSVLASGSGTTIQLWDTRSHERIGEPLDGHTDAVMGLAFGRDRSRLVSASADNTVQLWDVESRTSLSRSAPEGNIITSVAFSADGQHLVTGSMDANVHLWAVVDDEIRPVGAPMSKQSGQIAAVAFSPRGDRFISGSGEGTLRLWPVTATAEDLCAKLAPLSDEEWAAIVAPAVPRGPACPKAS